MSIQLPHYSFPVVRKRIAIFAFASVDGHLPINAVQYIAGLKAVADTVLVICTGHLTKKEMETLIPLSVNTLFINDGSDLTNSYKSYKVGLEWIYLNSLQNYSDEIILCNNSCFGPINSFSPMFLHMDNRELDFWGCTERFNQDSHVDEYFLVLRKPTYSSDKFRKLLNKLSEIKSDKDETLLTKGLSELGFTSGTYLENTLVGADHQDPTYKDLAAFPLHTLEHGMPLIKTEVLRYPQKNMEGVGRLVDWLRINAPKIYDTISYDNDIRQFEDAKEIGFSLILPTRNRAWCIETAIQSVLSQTHENFELIIIDDGSSDGTDVLIGKKFNKELNSGKIKYINLPENVGVCAARNIGLAVAKNQWIGYVDSDNTLREYYLSIMANCIISNKNEDAFYGQIISTTDGRVIGRPFDRKRLLEGNYIDLGVFIHRKSLVAKFGAFDTELRRLVDWDLIIRYTGHRDPIYVDNIFLDYVEHDDQNRISIRESFIGAKLAIHRKNEIKSTVSTAIVSYNHEEFIVEAIESALAQKGNFSHEIIISDDGSTDKTPEIIAKYTQKYPGKIRNITRGGNYGISENYKHCFRQAAGEFVAVLEGDDYWIDDRKNQAQSDFLINHPEAAMVFSMIELFDTMNNTHKVLDRQIGLNKLLTGEDFSRDPFLNLIINLSSSMYVKKIISDNAPSYIFEPRISEIVLPFYFDRIEKKVGFIDKVMGIWRMNPHSTWTGASEISKLEQAIAVRECALRIARKEYHPIIQKHIDKNQHQLELKKKQCANELVFES